MSTVTLRAKAVAFGLNYAGDADASMRLKGCVNDARRMAAYLREIGVPCSIYTDATDPSDTSAAGIVSRLQELAKASHTENLELAWIHFSGHGVSVRDKSGDEADKRDEALVPRDYLTAGYILDDSLNEILGDFNPKTRVICVFDCCHSGTLVDLKFSWMGTRCMTENAKCKATGPIITLSGCLDMQVAKEMDTSGEAADQQSSGVMTTNLLAVLKTNPAARANVFSLVSLLRTRMSQGKFPQIPVVTSSYDLRTNPKFL